MELNGSWSRSPAPSVFLFSSVFVLERGARWLLDGAPVLDGGAWRSRVAGQGEGTDALVDCQYRD